MASVIQQVLMSEASPVPIVPTYIGASPTTTITGVDTATIPGVSIGTAAANRMVFQVAHWYSSTIAPLASATINGVTANIQVSNGASASAGGAFLGTAIMSALVPTGATATVVLNFVTGSTFHNISLETYTATGVQSDTPIATISDNVNASSYSNTINVQNGGFLLFAAMCYSANTGYTLSGATQDYTVQLGTGSPSYISAGSSLAVSATQANRPVGITPIGGFTFIGTVVAASFR